MAKSILWFFFSLCPCSRQPYSVCCCSNYCNPHTRKHMHTDNECRGHYPTFVVVWPSSFGVSWLLWSSLKMYLAQSLFMWQKRKKPSYGARWQFFINSRSLLQNKFSVPSCWFKDDWGENVGDFKCLAIQEANAPFSVLSKKYLHNTNDSKLILSALLRNKRR